MLEDDLAPSKAIFDEVPDEQMAALANAMTWVSASMGEPIVSEGETGDAMYIVANGSLEAQMSDVGAVKEYIEGGYFGEQVRVPAEIANCPCMRGKFAAVCCMYWLPRLGRVCF